MKSILNKMYNNQYEVPFFFVRRKNILVFGNEKN